MTSHETPFTNEPNHTDSEHFPQPTGIARLWARGNQRLERKHVFITGVIWPTLVETSPYEYENLRHKSHPLERLENLGLPTQTILPYMERDIETETRLYPSPGPCRISVVA